MLDVRGLLVGEGKTDRALAPVLEQLCILAGADEAIVDAPDLGKLPNPPGKKIQSQCERAVQLFSHANLLFVHRDADARDPEPRYQEIADAVTGLGFRHVAVVPVQETEAWLLVEADAIRAACGRPSDTSPLRLPSVGAIENTANPKEVLQRVVARAQEKQTARRRIRFSSVRHQLLEQLDPRGEVTRLPSFQRLQRDLQSALDQLRRSPP